MFRDRLTGAERLEYEKSLLGIGESAEFWGMRITIGGLGLLVAALFIAVTTTVLVPELLIFGFPAALVGALSWYIGKKIQNKFPMGGPGRRW
jgi:hypothetical protein